MATRSSILARRIPKDRGAWWVTVHGVAVGQDSAAQHSTGGVEGWTTTRCKCLRSAAAFQTEKIPAFLGLGRKL